MSYWGDQLQNYNPQAEQEKKEIRSAGNRCGIILILMLAVMYGMSFGIGILVSAFREQMLALSQDTVLWDAALSLILNLLIYAVLVPILLFICNRFSGEKTAELLRLPAISGRELGKILVMGLGVVYISSYTGGIVYDTINNILLQLFGITMQSPDNSVACNPVSIAVLILSVSILAPFFEELLVRGGLVGLTKKYGCWFTAISTGILFGFMHTSFTQVFFAMMLGIYAGFMTYRTRSIWPTIILHIVVNSISVIQVILLSFVDIEQVDYLLNNAQSMDMQQLVSAMQGLLDDLIPLLIIELISLGVLAIAIVGMVKLVKDIERHPRVYNPKEYGSVLRLREKLKAFLTAPAVLIFFTISILLSFYNAFPLQ